MLFNFYHILLLSQMNTIGDCFNELREEFAKCDIYLKRSAHDSKSLDKLINQVHKCNDLMTNITKINTQIYGTYTALYNTRQQLNKALAEAIETAKKNKKAARIARWQAIFTNKYNKYDKYFKNINDDLEILYDRLNSIQEEYESGDIGRKTLVKKSIKIINKMKARISSNNADVTYIIYVRNNCVHDMHPFYHDPYSNTDPDIEISLFDLCHSFDGVLDRYIEECEDIECELGDLYQISHTSPYCSGCNDSLVCKICKYTTVDWCKYCNPNSSDTDSDDSESESDENVPTEPSDLNNTDLDKMDVDETTLDDEMDDDLDDDEMDDETDDDSDEDA